MSAPYYLILSALLAGLLMVVSPHFRQLLANGICVWFWILCLLLGGITADYFARATVRPAELGENFLAIFIGRFLLVGFVSILVFLFCYSAVGFSIFSFIERRQQVKLAKPSVWFGCVISLFSPIVFDVIWHNFRR